MLPPQTHIKYEKNQISVVATLNVQTVSLLSNSDKILERIVYNCLHKFFEDN